MGGQGGRGKGEDIPFGQLGLVMTTSAPALLQTSSIL